ncbi:MAG: DNA polymerase ligase N-terminal domain-containing protein, partial [Bauldia litoralis]
MAKASLSTYQAKRDFGKTAEPSGDDARRAAGGHRYLIQKHDATRMHFDFRLELDGVLLSWAVPNGPSYDPADKRLAVHVEDHPLDYGDFEGTIPKGEYGGGTVMLWDEGTWEPVGDPEAALEKGDFKFILHGERLRGKWVLVRMKPKPRERSKHENWLLIKEKDGFAGEETKPIIERVTTSVRSGRSMEEIAAGNVEWKDSGFNIKRGRSRTKAAGNQFSPPKFVAPQLASLVDAPPDGDDWLHEIKYDGYRAIAAIGGGEAAIHTRRGHDWTDRFQPLVRPLLDLPCRAALFDGEVTVTDKAGRTDFGALQDALGEGKGRGIGYHLFDLLSLDGEDLRRKPLIERKEKLAALLVDQPRAGPLFYSDHVVGHGGEMFA